MTRPEAKKSKTSLKPMTLEQTQRLVAMMVMRPLNKSWDMQQTWVDGEPTSALAETIIQPNDRLTSFERLEIYNKQYWFRLIECFSDDFPGLQAVLGEKKFEKLALAYLQTHPSRSFSLRNLGQFLISFLAKHPELIAPDLELSTDMAAFEWAQVEAFDGCGYPPLGPAQLATISSKPEKAKLHLQPYLQLLELRYPLDDFLLALKQKNAAMRGEASNAVEAPMHSAKKRMKLPRKERIFLAVHRFNNSLYYKRLSAEGFAALQHLRAGKPLAAAVDEAVLATESPDQDWANVIREWFETWTKLGWFCQPPPKKKK